MKLIHLAEPLVLKKDGVDQPAITTVKVAFSALTNCGGRFVIAALLPATFPVILYGTKAFAAHAADTEDELLARLNTLIPAEQLPAKMQVLMDSSGPFWKDYVDDATPVEQGEAWVAAQGFGGSRLTVCLNKLLQVKEGDPTLAAHPKLAAVYTWMNTVQAQALAGLTTFDPTPFSYEQILAE
jgi:hypothetical protein